MKTSRRYLCRTSWRRFEDGLKASWRRLSEMSWRCLEDVLNMSSKRLGKTSWTRLENVLKTSWRRMTDTNILVLTKTSSEEVWLRWIYWSWLTRLQEVFWRWRWKMSSSRRMLAGPYVLTSSQTIYLANLDGAADRERN